jgi:hypothetical protein
MEEIGDLIQESEHRGPVSADCDDLAEMLADELCRRTNSSGCVEVEFDGGRFVASIDLDDDGECFGMAKGHGPTTWGALVNLAMVTGLWVPA